MGKPLITQRRGKGSTSFRAPSHRFKARAHYRNYDEKDKQKITGEVVRIIDDPGRSTPLISVVFTDKSTAWLPAAEGLMLGGTIEEGAEALLRIGYIVPIGKIPEGFPIFNIEITPGDGGSLIRGSGLCGYITAKEQDRVLVKLPSGQIKYIDGRCRATIGCAAGGGRTDKPILKAGTARYKHLARGHWYPTVRGVHMNCCEHPFGGKQHHGAITPKGKGAPPGVHVGSFGARRTGRRKR